MRGKSQECTCLKQHNIDDTVDGVRCRQQYDVHDHKFSVEYEEPSHDGTYNAADVADAPHFPTATPVVHVDFFTERRVLVLHHHRYLGGPGFRL